MRPKGQALRVQTVQHRRDLERCDGEAVAFQDGTDLNAEAVKFNFERNLTYPGSNRRSEIGAVESALVIDPYTVQINLKTPFVPLIDGDPAADPHDAWSARFVLTMVLTVALAVFWAVNGIVICDASVGFSAFAV